MQPRLVPGATISFNSYSLAESSPKALEGKLLDATSSTHAEEMFI